MPSEKTKTARTFSQWERIPAEKFSPFRKNLEKTLDKPRAVCYNNKALSQGRTCVFPRDHDKNGLVAQLVRALACHARGRGFEPHPSRHSCNFPPADLAHLVERDLAKVEVAGSSPVIRSIRRHSQAVRQRSAKPSSPVRFRVAPPRKGHLRVSFLRWRRHSFIGSAPCRHAARNPVRICRSEIDKLACQAESVQIFAFGEIPGDAPSLHRAGSVPPCGTESGSHLPLGDRQARLSGEERADIRFQRNSG